MAVASAGDIETTSSKEPDVDFSNDSTSGSSDTSLIPQPASSSDAPTSNVIGSSTTAATPAESVAEDSREGAKLTLPPASLTVPSLTTDDPPSMDIDTGKNGSESLVRADPMQVDVENRPKGESSSTDVAGVAPPAWLIALNMDVYLQECSDATAWRGLIESLYKFENLNTISGVRCRDFITDCH